MDDGLRLEASEGMKWRRSCDRAVAWTGIGTAIKSCCFLLGGGGLVDGVMVERVV
jgi:hypothetical protein